MSKDTTFGGDIRRELLTRVVDDENERRRAGIVCLSAYELIERADATIEKDDAQSKDLARKLSRVLRMLPEAHHSIGDKRYEEASASLRSAIDFLNRPVDYVVRRAANAHARAK